VGAELIKTDNSFYLDDYTYLYLIQFYSTPNSKGAHAFASVPIGDKLRARAGWYYLRGKPYESAGEIIPEEFESQSFYLQLRLAF
jgi:hypothetical protein